MAEQPIVVGALNSQPASEEIGGSLGQRMMRTVATRLVATGLSLGVSLVATAIVISDAGVTAYGAIALVWSIPALLPFLDLGTGSAVVNAVADVESPDDTQWEPVFVAAFRTLLALSGLAMAVAVVFATAGIWPHLLGPGSLALPHLSLAASGVVLVFALSLPASLGYRVLQGRGRADVVTLIQAVVPAISLALVLAIRLLGADTFLYSLTSIVAAAAAAWFGLFWSLQRMPHPLSDLIRVTAPRHLYRQLFRFGSSAFLVSVGLAVALQSDRVILSHTADNRQLAQYSIAAQLYAPIWAILASSGMLLWPHYRQSSRRGELDSRTLARDIGLLGAAGLLVGAGYIAFAGPVALLLSHGRLSIDLSLRLSFAALFIVQCIQTPSGMLLTDGRGMAFQARLVLVMCIANVVLSYFLALRWGAAGPVTASALSVGVIQLLPTARAAFARLRPASQS